MQFLYPIGFIALASLLLPIIIHLWRVKQGKTLKIGSIALLGESAATNSRNLKISEKLLFLLRCLFFILIAMLIAKPYLKGKILTQNKAGWILLDERGLKSIYHQHQKKIDSLLKKGYKLKHFGNGFKQLSLKDTANEILAKNAAKTPLNYTSLLKQANQSLPNRYPIWVFAPKYATQFDDVLPTLHLAITWQHLSQKDTSNLKYTQFLDKTYKIELEGNAIRYSSANDRNATPLNVMVYPTDVEDAKYLKAALSAIGSYLNQPVQFHHNNEKSKELDVVFWLSSTPIPNEINISLKSNGVILRYADGKSIKNPSTIILGGNETEEHPLLKIRNIAAQNIKAETVWKDGFGNPILTVEEQKKHHYYTLYTQLNPQWTDLVWKDDFAQALIPILYHQKPNTFAFKQTQLIIDEQPIAVFTDANRTKTLYDPDKPLDKIIWVLAFIVLLIERMLSFKTKS